MSIWMTLGCGKSWVFYIIGGYEPDLILHKYFTVSGQGWFCLEAD